MAPARYAAFRRSPDEPEPRWQGVLRAIVGLLLLAGVVVVQAWR